jgi:type I restriction enzyme, S subunit
MTDNEQTNFSEIFTFRNGKTRPKSEGKYKVYGSGGLIGTCADTNTDGNVSVIGRVGTKCGNVFFVQDPSYVTDNAIIAKTKENFDPYYGYYLLKNKKLNRLRHGSGQPLINQDTLNGLKTPSLSKQQELSCAELLSSIDKKIKLNQQMNQTLEEVAKTLFKSWFIDFDPVRAKAEGRSTGLSKEISDLFPDSFEESELGEIPRGWKVDPLSQITSFKNGFAFKSKDWSDIGAPVIKIGNVKPLILDIDGCSFISDELAELHIEYLLSRGDIMIGMTGYVGETCLVPKLKRMPYQNQRVGKLIPNEEYLNAFLFSFLRQSKFKKKVEEISQGSAQQNVSGASILEIKFINSSNELIKQFSGITSALFEKILFNYEENLILTELRGTLLPKLISGELRIPDAEKLVEEAGV